MSYNQPSWNEQPPPWAGQPQPTPMPPDPMQPAPPAPDFAPPASSYPAPASPYPAQPYGTPGGPGVMPPVAPYGANPLPQYSAVSPELASGHALASGAAFTFGLLVLAFNLCMSWVGNNAISTTSGLRMACVVQILGELLLLGLSVFFLLKTLSYCKQDSRLKATKAIVGVVIGGILTATGTISALNLLSKL